MKKLLAFAALFAVVALTSCKYDDDDLWNSVHGLENRVAKLEELCKQMNTNISSLQTIVTALQNNVYVTGTTPLMKDGKEIGYTITFSKGNPITIYHGKDGQDGEDGITPTISVKKDTDGVYYWTLNGEFIMVDGGKIQAEGKDGTNGTNGTTPQFKIENDYWFVSYDNGANWTQLGKATGEDGIGGDSMFSGVDYKTSTDYVIFTLADGTQIKLPTWSAFEALQRLCNETNTNLSALQTIVTALQNNDYITSVDPLTENGKVVGYTIKFAKSNPIVIYNGKDGTDGVDGNTPVIGVKKDGDGIYYWTLDGEFIIVDGQKIKAQGTDGSDGADGVTPKLEIREGYWWISYDNGTNWTQLGKATGEDGKDADSIKITQDENNVYFELADGTVITISKTGQSVDPNIIQFADENVKKLCVGMWDTNGDLELSYDEAATVTSLGTTFTGNSEIQIFNELKHFTGLTVLDDAFSGCSNLWKVTIPVNVESMTFNNFKGCVSLKTITFEKGSKLKAFTGGHDNNYKILGAFLDCKSLTTIEIPASVESLGTAFKGSSLRTITFEKGSKLKSITGGYQNKDNYSGALSDCKALTFIEIPASVETIEIAAFTICSSLEMITFEKGSKLESISGVRDLGAFDGAINLTTVDMSECTQVKRIDEYTFYGNSNLRLFKIGTEIPPTCKDYTFYNINPYSVLKVPSGCTDAYKKATGWKKFASITGLDE
ncbi:PL29 family lyase N-terminal domain-containing protein [Alistipes putredinis]|uniref:PL29 family lyase N-terminal domain-containing protein n=1 Tax=Alistipes putredinis TaxID=28117 RepID=UPI002F941544